MFYSNEVIQMIEHMLECTTVNSHFLRNSDSVLDAFRYKKHFSMFRRRDLTSETCLNRNHPNSHYLILQMISQTCYSFFRFLFQLIVSCKVTNLLTIEARYVAFRLVWITFLILCVLIDNDTVTVSVWFWLSSMTTALDNVLRFSSSRII